MSKQYSVLIIGDIFVELSCILKKTTFERIRQDTLLYQKINLEIGGTGPGFAFSCKKYFNPVRLIGKIGSDCFGELVINEIIRAGVEPHCFIDPNIHTGISIYLRDSGDIKNHGIRLLLMQEDTPNRTLSKLEIQESIGLIKESDLIILDGYNFLKQPCRDAVFLAINLAHSNGVRIALDVVPHNAYELYNYNSLKSMLNLVDIFTIELATMRCFLGFDDIKPILDIEVANETCEQLRSEFINKIFFLRFGLGNIDQTLLGLPGKHPIHYFTGYQKTKKPRGFGNRLSAREYASIMPFFGNPKCSINL